jgi:hypothetical protein
MRAKQLNDVVKNHERDREVILRRLDTLSFVASEMYRRELLSDPRYADKKRLEAHGFKVYSQCDEDGIIQEIFRRIDPGPRTFVEFGVEEGLECNTLKLLLEGWSGLWIEADPSYVRRINAKFGDVIGEGRLRVREAFIDRDNIDGLIAERFTDEIGLLSIDIDGNDIHILDAINVVRPRVIVIEYNGKFPPPMNLVPRYDPGHRWNGCDYNGSSLEAIVRVADRKGYKLVGCNIAGVNAFLVRDDLVGEHFAAPFTAENHYQPTRYFLWQTFPHGHHPDWGPYEKA